MTHRTVIILTQEAAEAEEAAEVEEAVEVEETAEATTRQITQPLS